ncbi:unnamed protein product [Coffea canephora]|uniref:Uncharacterized protein n=1 Tax=Coffea canephora TaxID=49390 RepID=A0A068VFG2_COFCA|nr:unnamed protein product [Coffea canephora]
MVQWGLQALNFQIKVGRPKWCHVRGIQAPFENTYNIGFDTRQGPECWYHTDLCQCLQLCHWCNLWFSHACATFEVNCSRE